MMLMEEASILCDGEATDYGDYSDCPENLKINLDTLLAILDEKPDPSLSQSPCISRSFHEGELAPDRLHSESTFQDQSGTQKPTAVPEGCRQVRSSQWGGLDFEGRQEIGFISEPQGSSSCFTDSFASLPNANMKHYSSQGSEFTQMFSFPSCHPSQCIEPTLSEEDTLFIDSDGGAFLDLVTDNFENNQLQNSMAKYGRPSESTGVASFHSQDAVPVYDFELGSTRGEVTKQTGSEARLHMVVRESNSKGNTVSSLSLRQGGRAGSSNILYTEESGISGRMYNNVNTGPALDFGHGKGNICGSSLMYSPVDTTNAAHDMHDPRDNYLKMPVGAVSGDDKTPMETLSGQNFQPFTSCEKDSMIGIRDDNNLFSSQGRRRDGEIKLEGEQSIHNYKQKLSFLDMDVPVPEMQYAVQDFCQDTTTNSESSTDSSPIPSRRSSTSGTANLSGSNAANQLLHDKSVISDEKLKSHSMNKMLFWAAHCYQYNISDGDKIEAQNNSSRSSFVAGNEDEDDDGNDDVCILNDARVPAHPIPPVQIQPHPMTQRPVSADPYLSGSGCMRLRPNDERLTYHIALQDLSQPKSEASPPDGVLTVPLLRHQRIALSWMVQKETSSLHCFGGILADDQGLGKTVSMIALILTERSLSPRSCPVTEKQEDFQALNLDGDDEDDISELTVIKQPRKSSSEMINSMMKMDKSVMVKGRPAAGTLVVCPTSVLRQWAEELQNKVSSKANLTFLVYHGSSRTKDPNELAKYDVVLTTYAIVSMEVPKQPLVDKDDNEKVKTATISLTESLNSRKRKTSSSHNVKGLKDDSILLDSAARPLARVRWFRVILDEAQSIKNHRTQVARACWGLRAKRRWCLSGTPIQNAVDDLYSYFRFLRFDPYAVYKSFCSTIKVPISRNPTDGYRKLQAVLKTIMLRRTKGTLIDGKPIITLPPKTVTLKKVDFSEAERAFYTTLEAESREQFKEYAAAGTVKQNYVNILLMLLRLRQACDHYLLVKGHDSNSIGRTSTEMARKLHRGKQIELLSCLEANLAICSICNDPPEDAVVTICGHVFCNQCICEHLIGDDNICPSANCKTQLTLASVFARGTLKSSLSGVAGSDASPSCAGNEVVNSPQQGENSLSLESSKIKAALEILQSLPRCRFSRKTNLMSCDELVESGCNKVPVRCSLTTCETEPVHSIKDLNSQVTEKAIIFSQWTRMLDLLEVPLKQSHIKYRRLDGTMSVTAREKAVKDFNTRPEVTVMIMSLKAASLGLNMVAACHVLLLDLWWNPTTEDQAIDRAHRIGQTRPVKVSRLTVKDTVEDRILALQEKKREMVASAFGEDESGSRQTRLTVEDLKYLFAV